jgi:hypothetical protein
MTLVIGELDAAYTERDARIVADLEDDILDHFTESDLGQLVQEYNEFEISNLANLALRLEVQLA